MHYGNRSFSATLLIGILFFTTPSVFASDSETRSSSAQDPLDDLVNKPLYTVETDDQSASDSLNRISGNIETGYSSSEQSFKSKDQYAGGPWGLEKAKTGQS